MSTRGFYRDQSGPQNLLPGQRPPMMGKKEIETAMLVRRATQKALKDNQAYDVMLVVNTSESYRRMQDKHLYVSRAPHKVRPLHHTGFMSRLDGSERIELSLNNPVEMPEYQRDSVHFQTDHRLCLPCRDMFNYYCKYRETQTAYDREKKCHEELGEESVFPLANAVVHHFNLLSLKAFSNMEGCYVCQYVQQRIDNGFDIASDQVEEFQIECCWSVRWVPENKDTIFFVMYNPSIPKEAVWNYRHLFRLQLWPEEVFGHHFVMRMASGSIEAPLLENLNLVDFDRTDKPLTRALARTWYSDCKGDNEKHCECNRQNYRYLPSRLLDVQHAIETSQLRLVCPASQPSLFVDRKYATLSHCWGSWGASENPILITSDLEQRQKVGLEYSGLPQTFKDAVTVTHWLQIKWLWIDCLCIIQDSREDWIREARMMDQTYQNGEVNISSDFGKDSRSGLFVDRDYLDITSLQIEAPGLEKTWHITSQLAFDWMNHAKSFSRAWIHRERQLARRILHFTEKELVWECCGTEGTSFASESFPGGAPFKELFNAETKYQSGRLHESLTQGAEETYGVWNDLCEGLSDKYVTEPTDIPIILSSLAKEFHRVLPLDEHLAGLWKSTLPHGLAWRTKSYGATKRKVYAPNHRDRTYIAPSWSWLSVSVPVTLAVATPNMHKVTLVTIHSIDLKPSYDDPYGPVTYGALHLEGVLREIQIDFDDNGTTFELSVVDEQLRSGKDEKVSAKLRPIGSSWDDYEGDMCNLELDQRPEMLPLRCYCLLTAIEEWGEDADSNNRNITCLLLQPAESGDGIYKRIGVLILEDMYSLRIRYELAYDDEDETKSDEDSAAGDMAEHEVVDEIGESKDYDEMASEEDISEKQLSQTDEERSGDTHQWQVLLGFIKWKRWPVIEEAEEEERVEKRKENELDSPEKDEDISNIPDSHSTDHGNEEAGGRDEGQEGGIDATVSSQVEHCVIPTAGETGKFTPETDVNKERDDSKKSYWIPVGQMRSELRLEQASKHVEKTEQEMPEDDASEGSGPSFDYGALRSDTPAWGRHLPPLDALYQFDDVLPVIRKETGLFRWLKRLKTKKVTIV